MNSTSTLFEILQIENSFSQNKNNQKTAQQFHGTHLSKDINDRLFAIEKLLLLPNFLKTRVESTYYRGTYLLYYGGSFFFQKSNISISFCQTPSGCLGILLARTSPSLTRRSIEWYTFQNECDEEWRDEWMIHTMKKKTDPLTV